MCFIEQQLFEAAAVLLPRLMTGQQVLLSADHVRSFDDLSSLGSDPKGPCPVEHRAEFPDIRPSAPAPWLLGPQISTIRPNFGHPSPLINPLINPFV